MVPLVGARHRCLQWALRVVSVVLALSGVAFVGYPLTTDFVQHRIQSRLGAELRRPAAAAAYRSGALGDGAGLSRLRIPDLAVDVVVVEGTSRSALRAGAGHYPGTPLPGEEGNVAIAGHRTTYGKPFANLDRLHPGAAITLETPVGTYAYRVSGNPLVVANTDRTVLRQSGGRRLTLTTCHPKGSARQRLVVQAELVASSGRA